MARSDSLITTPCFSAALRKHPAADTLTPQTLMRRLAGHWPQGYLLLWQHPDLHVALLRDALDAAGVVVRQELFDELLAAIMQQKGPRL